MIGTFVGSLACQSSKREEKGKKFCQLESVFYALNMKVGELEPNVFTKEKLECLGRSERRRISWLK